MCWFFYGSAKILEQKLLIFFLNWVFASLAFVFLRFCPTSKRVGFFFPLRRSRKGNNVAFCGCRNYCPSELQCGIALASVPAESLRYCQGKHSLNWANFEDIGLIKMGRKRSFFKSRKRRKERKIILHSSLDSSPASMILFHKNAKSSSAKKQKQTYRANATRWLLRIKLLFSPLYCPITEANRTCG